jgi:hypothetical protein
VSDWLRCYLAGVAPLVWTVGLWLGWWTAEKSRVLFFAVWTLTIIVHIHRRREKDREQDAELARQRAVDERHDERFDA